MEQDGEWQPAGYFSKQMRGAENLYSATELETLSIVENIRHFSYYFYDEEFEIFTDHRPLCSLLSSDRLNARLRKMAMKLQPWRLKITYLLGDQNTMADALSRQEWRMTLLNDEKMIEPEALSDAGGCEGPALMVGRSVEERI